MSQGLLGTYVQRIRRYVPRNQRNTGSGEILRGVVRKDFFRAIWDIKSGEGFVNL